MRRWKLPVGIENFQEIRQAGFYYVDKTRLIEQLLEQWGKVPVLFLSLKNVDGLTFEDARYHLTELVGREAFLGRRSVFLIKKHEMVRKKFFTMEFFWDSYEVIQTGWSSPMWSPEMVLQIFWWNRRIRMQGSLLN